MSVFVVMVVLGSACLHALWNSLLKGGHDKFSEAVFNTIGASLLAVVLLVFFLPPLPAVSWPYLLASLIFHVSFYFGLVQAYQRTDLSYAYTLMRGSAPLFTALASVFILSQPLSLTGWLGIAMICLGILSLALDALRRLALTCKADAFNRVATLVAMGSALLIMAYTIIDGQGVLAGGQAFTYGCWLFVLIGVIMVSIGMLFRRKQVLSYASGRSLVNGMVGGSASLIAYMLVLWAMTIASVPLVAAMRECGVVFAMLIGVFFLKERFTGLRLMAILLVLAGIALLRLA